jgi:ribosome-interacting GTPase 1
MARTQKNKATALHLGILKARLAKLRRELITPKGGGGATGEGNLLNQNRFSDLMECLLCTNKLIYKI